MTNKDFVKPETDRFKIDYEMSEGEKIFAFFYVRISAFTAAVGLIYWMIR